MAKPECNTLSVVAVARANGGETPGLPDCRSAVVVGVGVGVKRSLVRNIAEWEEAIAINLNASCRLMEMNRVVVVFTAGDGQLSG